MNLASEQYWAAAAELCRKHGTLLVLDEVQTGLGRTGKLWAHEHYGLRPDIITVSKALSGGYIPVGAMMCSAEIFDRVYSKMERAVVHSSTFGRNQLAMVAALATLQTIDDEDIVDRARVTGEAFLKGLAPLVEKYELFHEVRGKGLIIGLVFGEPSSLRLKSRWKMMESARKGLFSQLVVAPCSTDTEYLPRSGSVVFDWLVLLHQILLPVGFSSIAQKPASLSNLSASAALTATGSDGARSFGPCGL